MSRNSAIETKTSIIRIDEEGILRLKIKQEMVVDEAEVKYIFGIIKNITGSQKVLELIEGGNLFMLDRPAQKYAAVRGSGLFIASAIIIRSNSMRMLFDFFNAFIKTKVPFRMFTNEQKALAWLRTFRGKSD